MLRVICGAGLAAAALASALAGDPPAPALSAAAAATFQGRCTACHTYGKGTKVGPDLKGVTTRRPRAWLRRFIHASSAMIAAGDPTATALFERFHHQRMPDWTDLTPRQIEDLLDYLAAGGPDRKAPDERDAAEAGPADVERGRALYAGAARFASGYPACCACHAVPGGTWSQGGSLGPPLDAAYLRFRDQPLTEYLRHHPDEEGAAAPSPLAPEEIFALKAYLRATASRAPVPPARGVARLPGGGG